MKVFYMPLFACDENLFSNGQDSMPYMTSMEIAKKSLIQMTILRTNYNHGQKAWDTFAFLRRFPIHTGPAPPLTPQTMLDTCIQNFFRVSTLYRVEGGRTARKFRKGCTVSRANREMTEKDGYCSTVPRTFVQDCSFENVNIARYS